jgi:hypothetical protein
MVSTEVQRFLQMLLDIDEIHISPTFVFSQSQERLKLMSVSCRVATLRFIEVDDIPNGVEVLRSPLFSEHIEDNLL